ncbi:MAG: hypothetical protein ABR915_03755, partial [Thermoguttaceae bacterium]
MTAKRKTDKETADKETRRGGDKESGGYLSSPCLLVSLSPRLERLLDEWGGRVFRQALMGAALLWAALPPLGLWPLAWLAPVAWVQLIRRRDWPKASGLCRVGRAKRAPPTGIPSISGG